MENAADKNKIYLFLLSFYTGCLSLIFTNIIIFCLKNGKYLEHVYLSLLVPCTPIITICLILFTGTTNGMPELSLCFLNSPISTLFKFSIGSPLPNYSFSWDQFTSSSLHSIVRC